MSSSTGQIFGAVVGGIIGYFVPGVGVFRGAAYGYALGTVVDPPKARTGGPRLQDKRLQGAEYGWHIPKIYGTAKTGGWLLWCRDIYERVYDTGKPTGPVVTPYFRGAFALCEGPILGISRVWADGKLFWDSRDVNAGPMGVKFFAGTSDAAKWAGADPFPTATFTVYAGTETQAPDPLIESFLGAGNVPAYRGLAYIVMDDVDLTNFGRRIPFFEFEVLGAGSRINQAEELAQLDRYQSETGAALLSPANLDWYSEVTGHYYAWLADATLTGVKDGFQFQARDPGSGAVIFSRTHDLLYLHPRTQFCPDSLDGSLVWYRLYDGLYLFEALSGTKRSVFSSVTYSSSDKGVAVNGALNQIWTASTNNIDVLDRGALLSGAGYGAAKIYSIPVPAEAPWGPTASVYLWEIPHRQWMVAKSFYSPITFRLYDQYGIQIAADLSIGGSTDAMEILRVDAANDMLWTIRTEPGSGFRLVGISLASLTETVTLDIGAASGLRVLCLAPDLAAVVYYAGADKTIRFSNGAGAVFLTIDVSAQVNVYGAPHALVWCAGYGALLVRYAETRLFRYRVSRLQATPVSLGDITRDLCLQAGIASDRIDVTAITETCNGYLRDGRMQARDAIEPLRKAAFFDLIHTNGQVKAVKRGGNPVKTIAWDELVMGDDGVLPLHTTWREDQDVASTMEVSYNDPAIDHEINTQRAVRPTANRGDIAEERLPLSLSAHQARRIADILLYAGATQRSTLTLPLGRAHLDLDDADPITFVWPDGATSRMVVTQHSYTYPLGVAISVAEEDASLYTHVATGTGAGWTPPSVAFSGALAAVFLDIPILRDADDYEGAYVVLSAAASPAASATLWESVDNGATYNSLGTFGLQSTGYASTALASYTGGAWDETSAVTVTLNDGALESYTDAQALNGSGLYLIGNEIIQACTATLVSANTYTLSRLLRGRRGTEWAIGTHAAGERVVPLSVATARIASSARNQTRLYKAALAGQDLATISPVAFTNTQAGKKPFSVAYITGTRDGSGNLTGTFVRRSRIGTAWGSAIDIPLGEDIEKYEIDILSGATVKRTITVTAPSFSYTAAEQTADFGSAQASILVNIYQMSAIVGRGYVAVATI